MLLSTLFQTKAIETGKLRINGEMVAPDYVLKNNDKISHTVHRHELPVLGTYMFFLKQ